MSAGQLRRRALKAQFRARPGQLRCHERRSRGRCCDGDGGAVRPRYRRRGRGQRAGVGLSVAKRGRPAAAARHAPLWAVSLLACAAAGLKRRPPAGRGPSVFTVGSEVLRQRSDGGVETSCPSGRAPVSGPEVARTPRQAARVKRAQKPTGDVVAPVRNVELGRVRVPEEMPQVGGNLLVAVGLRGFDPGQYRRQRLVGGMTAVSVNEADVSRTSGHDDVILVGDEVRCGKPRERAGRRCRGKPRFTSHRSRRRQSQGRTSESSKSGRFRIGESGDPLTTPQHCAQLLRLG